MKSRWHGRDQFYFSQESVPDNAASAGFCQYHQKGDLEETCHFPPVSAFLVMSPAVGSPQGLGAPWGSEAACQGQRLGRTGA